MNTQATAPTRHWPFGGSTCSQWLRCPGWYATCKNIEAIETEEMREGTKNHAICHEYAVGSRKAEDVPLRILPLANAWKTLVDVRLGWRIEVPCELKQDFAGTTLDAVWYDDLTDTLHVADLKTGEMPVSAYQNAQLLFGAAAWCSAQGGLPSFFQLSIVHFDEDEGYKIKSWSVTRVEMIDFCKQVDTAISSNRSVTADEVVASDNCGFCRGRSVCRAHHTTLHEVITVASPGLRIRDLPDPKDVAGTLTPTQMSQILSAKKYVNKLFEAVEKRAFALGGVPGWSVGTTKPHLQWKLPLKDTLDALTALGIDGTDVITPSAAQKELSKVHGKAVAAAAVARLAERPEGTAKLVADNGSSEE